jgi:hypothetical protein
MLSGFLTELVVLYRKKKEPREPSKPSEDELQSLMNPRNVVSLAIRDITFWLKEPLHAAKLTAKTKEAQLRLL